MATTTQTKTKVSNPPAKVDLARLKAGDIFSESAHYVFKNKARDGYVFRHLASGMDVTLSDSYVRDLLLAADQFDGNHIIEVGKEDKLWTAKQIEEAVRSGDLPKDVKLQPREGDVRVPGIRTIWSNINGPDVFAVRFKKADKSKSKKKLDSERAAQLNDLLSTVNGKTIATIKSQLADAITKAQETPILDYEPGEERTLRGYKVQFNSINGHYDVIDMDLDASSDPAGSIRKVNVNEIIWLVYRGIKYIVK